MAKKIRVPTVPSRSEPQQGVMTWRPRTLRQAYEELHQDELLKDELLKASIARDIKAAEKFHTCEKNFAERPR